MKFSINADQCPVLRAHNPKVRGSNPLPATNQQGEVWIHLSRPFLLSKDTFGILGSLVTQSKYYIHSTEIITYFTQISLI